MEKVLYHYTSTWHLPQILNDGYLKLTESNLRYPEEMYKPVVWLTTSENPYNHGLEGSMVDKSEIRITVKWQKHFKKWLKWSRENKIEKWWAKALEEGNHANTWWISQKIILLQDCTEIENLKTGEVFDITKVPIDVARHVEIPLSMIS